MTPSQRKEFIRLLKIYGKVDAIRKYRASLIFEHGNAWWVEHKADYLAEMEKVAQHEEKK